MTEWEEFDAFVAKDISKQYKEDGFLQAHISILLAKNEIGYQTEIALVQQKLLERFNVEYALEDISDLMMCMQYETEDIVEHEEDFYEGY